MSDAKALTECITPGQIRAREQIRAPGQIPPLLARWGRCVLALCLVLALCVSPEPSRAVSRAEIYQATVPLADHSEAAQSAAFEAAMRVVLVRVTGRRAAADDPTLAPLVVAARRYVQQYRSAADGMLWVSFDGPALERWLTQNGQPLWGHTRPATAVFLAVAASAQGGTVIAQGDASELKSAVDAAAAARGVPLIWPSAADLQRDHIDYAMVTGSSASTLAETAHRLGAEGVLVGRAANAGATAPVRWSFTYKDKSSELSADAAEGPNKVADVYADLFAASGAVAPVDLEVTGIRELKDYAGVQTYLESIALVTHVDVEDLAGETVHFRLTARGGADGLKQIIALDGRLQPIAAGDTGILRFQLRR
jgi:hypothetical protein